MSIISPDGLSETSTESNRHGETMPDKISSLEVDPERSWQVSEAIGVGVEVGDGGSSGGDGAAHVVDNPDMSGEEASTRGFSLFEGWWVVIHDVLLFPVKIMILWGM